MYREVRLFKYFCWTLFRAREAFASLLADHAKQLLRNPEDRLPFHLHMMECLLDETCSFFHQKVERWFKRINVMYNFSWGFLLLFILAFCFQNRLKLVTERILEELTNDVNIGGYAYFKSLRGPFAIEPWYLKYWSWLLWADCRDCSL